MPTIRTLSHTLGAALVLSAASTVHAQQNQAAGRGTWTAQEDHRQMMTQLGITALRPGPSGNEQDANHANYDDALANPFPKLPELLTLKNGRPVTTSREWTQRRAEIIEDFEREVYGRIPAGVPKVTWTVAATDTGTVAGRRVVGRQLTGRVDNAAHPEIAVDISVIVVLPADVKTPVPLMMMFRGGALPQAVGRPAPPLAQARVGFTFPPPAPGGDAPATEQLIVDGWGFAWINPASIQADNGAGLTKGIIGLVNRGQPRTPDDWGALRAWSWGAARALDYLETDRAVNARQVGIEGVSRYGKAALVTMAFEPRFALGLIGSSGEGGAKLHRRNWGEAVESLTGSGEYHWMAGNFLKYGAASATFGSRNAGDLPVDAHELLALCAPRLTFISYGVPERGDAKWLDQQGSFMAAIAAQPAFRLLGARGLGRSDDYATQRMPPVNVGLLDGQLAWRQHDGGHTDAPNWKYFLPWADRFFARTYTPAPSVPAPVSAGASSNASGGQATLPVPADTPTPRTDANSMLAHQQLLEKRAKGRIDVYFEGNSITRRWGATDYPDFLANWNANFHGWNAADFGWGADRIEHMLWRLEHGELDGVNPRVIVLLAGTNNVGTQPGGDAKVDDITRGIKALLDICQRKAPEATIILTAIFPRNDNIAVMPEITRINAKIARFADGKRIRYVNINDKLADADGRLHDGVTMDKLHPTVQGYQIWADALKPILTELLGPPAAIDLAPPPTGDPSAKPPAAQPPTEPPLRLARIFGDGMVLQRDQPIRVWGWCAPSATVSVSLRGHTAHGSSDRAGAWTVELPRQTAGGPYMMQIDGCGEHRTVRDVLIGDVWIASGQSNMEFTVASANNAANVIAAAHDPRIRQFKVPTAWAAAPAADLAGGAWAAADPAHVGSFSAVAYFFARELRKTRNVPIGIVNTTWGGSAIETWMSRRAHGFTDDAWAAVLHAQEVRGDSVRAALTARIGALPTHDAGLENGRAAWADPSLDDRTWSRIPVPAYWEEHGFQGLDGVAWYRTSFALTTDDVRSGIELTMQAIDDDDITWVNGAEVGRTAGYNKPRRYAIPASALRVGSNVLAVRVADGGGGGGINGRVSLTRGSTTIPLDAAWRFKVGEVSFSLDGQQINKVPTVVYNEMIHPLLPFAMKGVIWYQGESNADNDARARAYRAQFASLVSSWRTAWQMKARAFPFLWVQLPNFGKADTVPPVTAAWALQRESMASALALANTGQAITIDLGDADDIHPRNKQDVGTRLALVARRVAYGDRVLASGPRYRSHSVQRDTIRVVFDDVGEGLTTRPADAVGGFAIAGADKRWFWASARVVGNRVFAWSPHVAAPVALRYAWGNNPARANLYGRNGLPAAPFRTDRW